MKSEAAGAHRLYKQLCDTSCLTVFPDQITATCDVTSNAGRQLAGCVFQCNINIQEFCFYKVLLGVAERVYITIKNRFDLFRASV